MDCCVHPVQELGGSWVPGQTDQPGQGAASRLLSAIVKVFLNKVLSSFEKIWLQISPSSPGVWWRWCWGGACKVEHVPRAAFSSIQTWQAPGRVESCPVLWCPLSDCCLWTHLTPFWKAHLLSQWGTLSLVCTSLLCGIDVLYMGRREEKAWESIDGSKSCCRLLTDHKPPLSYVYKPQSCCIPIVEVL